MIKVEISPWFYILLAAAIQLLPFRLLAASMGAAVIHEMSHFAALKVCRVPVSHVKIAAAGARIYTAALTPTQEILCAAAGPAGSFSLLILSRWLPYWALIGFVHGIFNLLPVYPFDGGRIMRGGIYLLKTLPDKRHRKTPCKDDAQRVQ